jgi:hypothetical protein
MSDFLFRVSVVICLVGSVLVTPPARANDANDANDAEALIKRGIELRRNRDDQAAAREFQKAYRLAPSARAAGQLGLAEQAVGRWEDAERHVSEALRARGDQWVARNRAALDQSLAIIQEHLGRLEIKGDPDGAEVSVNGRAVGHLPLPEAVRVSAGQVDIDLRAPGFVPVQRTVTIVGGQYQPVVIHLAREPAPAAPQNATSPTPVAVTKMRVPPEPDPPAETRPEAGAESGPSRARIALKWTAAGLAAAGLTTAVIGYALYRENVHRFDTSPAQCGVLMGKGYSMVTNMPNSECQLLLTAYETDQKIAIAGAVGAGVFAAAWLALFLTEPSAAPDAAQASRWPTCAATPGAIGISCSGRF